MARFALAALLLLAAPATFAAGLVLTEPDLIECKMISNPGFAACNLWYDKVMIHEGLARSPANAGGDCAICKNFKAAAKRRNMNVYVELSLNWDDDGFMSLTYDETPGPFCR